MTVFLMKSPFPHSECFNNFYLYKKYYIDQVGMTNAHHYSVKVGTAGGMLERVNSNFRQSSGLKVVTWSINTSDWEMK